MKLVVVTIRELSKKGIEILIHEDFDSQVVITEDGFCYLNNLNNVAEILSREITQKIMSVFDVYHLTKYIKDPTIIVNTLDTYTSNKTLMAEIYKTLLNNHTYITATRLSDLTGIDKKTCKLLINYLLSNNMINPYYSYYIVTNENVLVITDTLKSIIRQNTNDDNHPIDNLIDKFK